MKHLSGWFQENGRINDLLSQNNYQFLGEHAGHPWSVFWENITITPVVFPTGPEEHTRMKHNLTISKKIEKHALVNKQYLG